jgi:hypothetical protein
MEDVKMKTKQEMETTEKSILPLKLQLFAEETGNEGGEPGGNAGDNGDDKNPPPAKTFTQEELNAIAKREKEEGKKSILKELGFEDIKTVKDGLSKFKEWQDSQKTEAEKTAQTLKEKEDAITSANDKLALANAKLDAVKAGVNPKYVDDVVALAMIKISDEKPMETVLTEMKETYPNFFENVEENDDGSKGTGSKVAGKKGKIEIKGIGERLAKKGKVDDKDQKKSSYFSR